MNETTKTIRLSATLRTIAGAKTIDVPIPPGATVRDLLIRLIDAHPLLADRVIGPDGGLSEGIQLIIGGRHIDFLQGLDTPVGAPDDVLLIPPLSGG